MIRSTVTSCFAAIAAALVLLHCAGGDDNGASPVAEDSGPASPQTDGAPNEGAADAGAPSDGGDGGEDEHCSADHWCRVPLPGNDIDLAAVWSFGPKDAYAVGADGMIHWDGTTWSFVDAGDAGLQGLASLWASGPNDLWAVATSEHRLVHGKRAADGSLEWSTSESDGGPTRDFVTGLGSSDLWLGGLLDDGTPMLEHGVLVDGGSPTFSTLSIGSDSFSLNRLCVTANNELWVAGRTEEAVVLHGVKQGNDYVWDTSLDTQGLQYTDFPAIWGVSPTEMWAIGVDTENYHRTTQADGGIGWETVPSHVTLTPNQAWGSGKDDVWTVGYLGSMRHWDGTSWSVTRLSVKGVPLYDNLFAIHGSSTDDVWAVGPGVAIHHTLGGSP